MPEIVVLCPTRENAAGARDMLTSFYRTVDRVGSEVILVVDRDDPQLGDYLALPEEMAHTWFDTHATPDLPNIMVLEESETGNLSAATNTAVKRVWGEDCIIGHVGDDHRFLTRGWDTSIREVLISAPGVAYAYDGFVTEWASQWFTNSIIPRTLGWLALPGSKHLCIDDAYMLIGAGLGRLHYLRDVLIEHLHPASGKVPWRPIVRGHYDRDKWHAEKANLLRWIEGDMEGDIEELCEVLGIVDPVRDETVIEKLRAAAEPNFSYRAPRVPKKSDWKMW